MVSVVPARAKKDLRQAKILFEEYAATLDFALDFQNFEEELAVLPPPGNGQVSGPNLDSRGDKKGLFPDASGYGSIHERSPGALRITGVQTDSFLLPQSCPRGCFPGAEALKTKTFSSRPLRKAAENAEKGKGGQAISFPERALHIGRTPLFQGPLWG
jgi:hypothetical protein